MKPKIPVSVGVGYHRTYLDMGEQVITSESGPEPLGYYHSWDRAHMLSVGFCIDFYIRFSAGMSLKWIESKLLPPTTVGASVQGEPAKADASDFGFMIQLPLIEMLQKLVNRPLNMIGIQPYMIPGFN